MVQLLPLKRMRERLNHMRLPNQRGKVFWPPLARKYLISHGKRKQGRRAGPSALAENGCGCFVPDLTRLTAPPCEEARRVYSSIAHRGKGNMGNKVLASSGSVLLCHQAPVICIKRIVRSSHCASSGILK